MITAINEENVEFHLTSDGYLLLVATAGWCGPCTPAIAIVGEIAKEFPQFRVAQLDIDTLPEVTKELQIRGIPSYLLFNDGEHIGLKVGAMQGDELRDWLKAMSVIPLDEPAGTDISD